jgi:hypothetical protein
MDTALLVITLLSVGLTGALLVYASKLQREQREREDARVVALAQEIQVDAAPVAATVFRRDLAHATGTSTVPMAREREHLSLHEPQPAVTMPERDTAPARQGLFSVDAAPEHPSRRLAIPAIGAAVVGIVIGVACFVSARPGAALRPAAPAAAALELVSLEQARTGQALTVRGIVRNPAGAAPRSGVAAVVFVFDRSGAFVTSSRAAIDYQVLGAGDESPFSVAVPNAADAARYRVSFRTERDVLPHVDRREGPKGPRAQGLKG